MVLAGVPGAVNPTESSGFDPAVKYPTPHCAGEPETLMHKTLFAAVLPPKSGLSEDPIVESNALIVLSAAGVAVAHRRTLKSQPVTCPVQLVETATPNHMAACGSVLAIVL